MKIAVLSGKGGTGKTFVSVNMAACASKALYVDCDVEEPNGHLFLKPQNIETKQVSVMLPKVDKRKCTGCRKCVDFCRFNALAYIKSGLLIFNEVCHSCGGCVLLCPEKALIETEKPIGTVMKGTSDNVTVFTGELNTGEASGVPIINELIHNIPEEGICVIDCPPGSACVVMESIKDADYCLLVAEPTQFGVHNLNMVYELVKLFNKPFGVIINKCFEGENPAETFCMENNIKVLDKIPFCDELAKINTNGLIAARENSEYYTRFKKLLDTIIEEVRHETIANT